MKLKAALLATAVACAGATAADPATHYQQRCAAFFTWTIIDHEFLWLVVLTGSWCSD